MDKQQATSFISNAIILLENLDDLKDSLLWSKEVKYYGNRFVKELEKKVLPVENELAKDEGEYKMIQDIQKYYEYILGEISSMDIYKLAQLKQIIEQYQAGTIIQASPEQINRINEEKATD